MVVVVGPGGGGLEERRSPCSMAGLETVDVVSFALAVGLLGSLEFEVPVFESIPVATTAPPGPDIASFMES